MRKPVCLPENVRRAIAHAALTASSRRDRIVAIRLTVKVHHNKQMTLTLHEGPLAQVVLRLHKRLHKSFYSIVAQARALLEKLTMVYDAFPAIVKAPVALIPASVPITSTVPQSAAEPSPASSLREESGAVLKRAEEKTAQKRLVALHVEINHAVGAGA